MATTPKHLQAVIIRTPYRRYCGLATWADERSPRVRVLFLDDILNELRELWFEREDLEAA